MTPLSVGAFDIWRNTEQLCSATGLYYCDFHYIMLWTYANHAVCKAFVAFLFILTKVSEQDFKWLKKQIITDWRLWVWQLCTFECNFLWVLPTLCQTVDLKSVTSGKEKQNTVHNMELLRRLEIAPITLNCLFDLFSGAHTLSGCTWSRTAVWLHRRTRADSDVLTLRASFHPHIQGHVLLFLEVKEWEL